MRKNMRAPDYPSADVARWSEVDDYFANLLAPSDDHLRAALIENSESGLPPHDVSATQGKMLALFARMISAKRILEIGTLGAYSSIWMARAMPAGGKIVTIEFNKQHAEAALRNIERAGLSDAIDVHIGKALDILPTITGTFDLIFIDADKPNNPHYLRWALQLSQPGTVIIGDNVVRGGAVADPTSEDANVKGVREFLEIIANEPRLDATAIQTVGEKGWDGFSLAVVVA
jgi:predicted O-methyltransferase YrrM